MEFRERATKEQKRSGRTSCFETAPAEYSEHNKMNKRVSYGKWLKAQVAKDKRREKEQEAGKQVQAHMEDESNPLPDASEDKRLYDWLSSKYPGYYPRRHSRPPRDFAKNPWVPRAAGESAYEFDYFR